MLVSCTDLINLATQWIFNFVVARAVPNMLVTVGNQGYGTYFIFGSFCFSMYVSSMIHLLAPSASHLLSVKHGKTSQCTAILLTPRRFFFVWFLVPETKGMSLERMDDLFGVTELANKLHDAEDHEASSPIDGEKHTGAHVEATENTWTNRLA
jgi:hypothetical protein